MDKKNIVSNLSGIHLEEKVTNDELIDIAIYFIIFFTLFLFIYILEGEISHVFL
jgi:hypothetical protein